MKFNINKYEGNYAMHCKTEEEAKIFCRYSEGSTIHRITFRKAIKLNANRNSKLATEFVVLRKIMKLAA